MKISSIAVYQCAQSKTIVMSCFCYKLTVTLEKYKGPNLVIYSSRTFILFYKLHLIFEKITKHDSIT